MQSTDLKVREDVVRGLYLEGVEELYVASREVGTQSLDQQHIHKAHKSRQSAHILKTACESGRWPEVIHAYINVCHILYITYIP